MQDGWFDGSDGTRLYYRVEGQGLPLILNDGIGCDGFIWKYLKPYLLEKFQIVHWHYKGHGRSDMPRSLKHLSIPDSCRDLNNLCEKLDLPPAVIVGHSMGVQVVFEFWHMFPERVCGLVPICGSYGKPLDTFHDNLLLKTVFPYARKIMDKQPGISQQLWSLITDSELAYKVATTFEVDGRMMNRDDFKPYFQHIASMDIKLFMEMLARAQEHDGKPYLGEIDVPVLIVGGEKDTFTPVWLSNEMKATIPGAELLMIQNGSHAAPIEQPELVNLRVEKFLIERVLPAALPTEPEKESKSENKAPFRPKKAAAKKKAPAKTKAAPAEKTAIPKASVKKTSKKKAPAKKKPESTVSAEIVIAEANSPNSDEKAAS